MKLSIAFWGLLSSQPHPTGRANERGLPSRAAHSESAIMRLRCAQRLPSRRNGRYLFVALPNGV